MLNTKLAGSTSWRDEPEKPVELNIWETSRGENRRTSSSIVLQLQRTATVIRLG